MATHRSTVRKRLGHAAAVAVALTLTGTGPAQAAAAVSLDAGDGTVSARGAAVQVPLIFTCPEDWRYALEISVVEAVGDGFANGSGSEQGVCTGARQKVALYVQANVMEGNHPFRPGPASVIANLYAGDPPELHFLPCPLGLCYLDGRLEADREYHKDARVTETVELWPR